LVIDCEHHPLTCFGCVPECALITAMTLVTQVDANPGTLA
jgi:hypothetical protein